MSSRATTRDPRAGGNVRRNLQRLPGRVDSRLRGNDEKSRHPGQRPGIHVLAVTTDVRWNLKRTPGWVDSRLRGNDKKYRHPERKAGIHLLAVTSDVRWNLQRVAGRVDSRLRRRNQEDPPSSRDLVVAILRYVVAVAPVSLPTL